MDGRLRYDSRMPRISLSALPALLAALLLALTVVAPAPAQAQDTWQFHMAQANSFYRNRLLPKALAELEIVVADDEGKKQLKAWQLIVEISGKLKDLDKLIWALENGRELASGQEAAQMQAQLYRLKRVYGRVVFEATGGSGKLPAKVIVLKAKVDIDDPEAKGYFEKARVLFTQQGYALGSSYLPAGDYELDGAPLKIVAGKDTLVEVAPTTDVRFALEIGGVGGIRVGQAGTGVGPALGGIDLGVGPHIQFATGNSLVVHAGPILLLSGQNTQNVRQDDYLNHSTAQLSVGGTVMVGLEFKVGKVDLSPRVGFAAHYLASGLYYRGKVVSTPDDGGVPSTVLEGEFIVPAIAYGPRLGFQALVTPALNERGKRVPRVFIGLHGGPIWAAPLWGDVGEAGSAVGVSTTTVRDPNDAGTAVDTLRDGPFSVESIVAGEDAGKSKVYADVHAVIGVQVRL